MVDYVTKFQCILVSFVSSQDFSFLLLLPTTEFINNVFPVPQDVLAISRLFSSRIYKVARLFIHSDCNSERV